MTRNTRRRRRKETGQEPKGGWVCCHVVVQASLFLTVIMGEKRGGGGGEEEGDRSTTGTEQETDRFRGKNASCIRNSQMSIQSGSFRNTETRIKAKNHTETIQNVSASVGRKEPENSWSDWPGGKKGGNTNPEWLGLQTRLVPRNLKVTEPLLLQ